MRATCLLWAGAYPWVHLGGGWEVRRRAWTFFSCFALPSPRAHVLVPFGGYAVLFAPQALEVWFDTIGIGADDLL